jgi:glyoxylase-like metal-dependent hydrolase (beta-lactamase superfamily II)
MQLGDIEILPVLDSDWVNDPREAFAKSPEALEAHKDLLTPDGMLAMPMGGFFIRRRAYDRVALVDLGLGRTPLFGRNGDAAMLKSLAALGYRPEDISDVILTHLHLDHVGWASIDGRPTFPNATYRCHKADWDHWVVRMAHAKEFHAAAQRDLMKPTEAQLEPWTGDVTLLPGVDARHVPGHTPGNCLLVLSSGEQRAMLLGDVVHCPMQLIDEEWDGLSDVDPVAARAAKNALAREIEGQDIPVAAAHFAGMQFGRLIQGEQRRRFVF